MASAGSDAESLSSSSTVAPSSVAEDIFQHLKVFNKPKKTKKTVKKKKGAMSK